MEPFHIVRVITRQRKGSACSAPVHAPDSALPDENHSTPVARSKPRRRFLTVQVLHLEDCFRPDHVERADAPLTHPVEIDDHSAGSGIPDAGPAAPPQPLGPQPGNDLVGRRDLHTTDLILQQHAARRCGFGSGSRCRSTRHGDHATSDRQTPQITHVTGPGWCIG